MLTKLIKYYGLDTLVTLEQEGTRSVSSKGIKQIQKLLGVSPGEWPKGFDPALETPTGKFAKRIANWYMDWYGDLDNKTKAEVGRLAESNASPAERVYLDLTHNIMNWQPGSFRDNRSDGQLGTGTSISCFRHSYAHSKYHLMQLGAVTMRLFRPGGNPHGRNFYGRLNGAGRAFLVPYNDVIVLINYYGLGGDGNKWAMIVSELARQAGLTVTHYLAGKTDGNGREAHGIYINGSGTYVISGPDDPPYGIHDLDFEPPIRYRTNECQCCQQHYSIPKDDYIPRRYCPDCGVPCAKCENEHVYALMTWVSDTQTWLCERCIKSSKAQAWPCGRVLEHGECSCEECEHGLHSL